MILGLILGISYLYVYSEGKFKVCKFIAIVMLTKLTFYYFYPKSPLMLYSLTNQKQVSAWAYIYSEMKRRWILSLFVGFLGYFME